MFGRPGFRTSEFLSAAVNVVVQIALAWNGTLADKTAAQLGVAGCVAYIVSRGLAKYEPRPTVETTPPAGPPPPAA